MQPQRLLGRAAQAVEDCVAAWVWASIATAQHLPRLDIFLIPLSRASLSWCLAGESQRLAWHLRSWFAAAIMLWLRNASPPDPCFDSPLSPGCLLLGSMRCSHTQIGN